MSLDPNRTRTPKNVRRAALPILLIIAAIIIIIFVGLNINHYKSLRNEQALSNSD